MIPDFRLSDLVPRLEELGMVGADLAEHKVQRSLFAVQKFLWDKHYIWVQPDVEVIGSDEWEYKFVVRYLPKEFHEVKRRASHFESYDSFSYSGGACYMGAWDTPESALLEGIKYAINTILK